VSELARVEAEQRGTLCLVRIHGEVDISNAQEVSAAIEAAVPNSALGLVVDLTDTMYLDSAGVALLLRLAERLQARRQQMSLVAPAESPIRVALELTGIPKVMRVTTRLDAIPAQSERGLRG